MITNGEREETFGGGGGVILDGETTNRRAELRSNGKTEKSIF